MSISFLCSQCIQLSRIRGLGLKRFHLLYNFFGGVRQIVEASHSQLLTAGLEDELARQVLRLQSGRLRINYLDKAQAWEADDRHYIVCLEDPEYPPLMRELYCPPPVLYLKGNLQPLLDLPGLAIVGSRKSTMQGKRHAAAFAEGLAQAGFNIVSGLALGIDAAAHRGALRVKGVTTAVLATGLDIVYPRQHAGLADEVCETGVLLSEMGLGTAPKPDHFPRRNRLISGLSQGVLVVEAGQKSGSLITADFALEQNREVFVIPGSIDNPVAAGCHQLLKQGAQLVTAFDDILESFNVTAEVTGKKTGLTSVDGLSQSEQTLINVLGFDVMAFDELIQMTGLPISELNQLLISLEIKGALAAVSGGYQRT